MNEIEKKLQLSRFREALKNLQSTGDLETLAKKTIPIEEYEKAALKMVEDLKANGTLSPEEERQLKDLIAERVSQPGEEDLT
jgi:hypothetical protein